MGLKVRYLSGSVSLSSFVAVLAKQGVFTAPASGWLPTIPAQGAGSGAKSSFGGRRNGEESWCFQEVAELVGLTRGLCPKSISDIDKLDGTFPEDSDLRKPSFSHLGFDEATEDRDGGKDRSRRGLYRLLSSWSVGLIVSWRKHCVSEAVEVRTSQFKTLCGTTWLGPFVLVRLS